MKKLIAVSATLCFMFLAASRACGQEVSLTLTPATQELVVQPGKTVRINYKLTNMADPQSVRLVPVELEPKSGGTLAVHDKVTMPIKIRFNDGLEKVEPFFLKQNEVKNFYLDIAVPTVVQEKDYYFGVMAQSLAPPTTEGSITARVQLGVTGSILLSVSSEGAIEVKPRLIGMDIQAGHKLTFMGREFTVVTSGEKLPLAIKLSNQGRYLMKPQGTVTLSGIGIKKNYNIIPHRILSATEAVVPLGSPSADHGHSAVLPGFFLGPYKIAATINFGSPSPVIYGSATVLALPHPLALGILLSVAVLLKLLIFKRR